MKQPVHALLALVLLGATGLALAGELDITIDHVKKPVGTLIVTLMNSEAQWNNQDKPFLVRNVPAKDSVDGKGQVTVKFADLPEGDYAVTVIHDENDNQKLDLGFMHIPTEGWGNSNNPKVWRKPYFSEVKVGIGAAPLPIVIHMH